MGDLGQGRDHFLGFWGILMGFGGGFVGFGGSFLGFLVFWGGFEQFSSI